MYSAVLLAATLTPAQCFGSQGQSFNVPVAPQISTFSTFSFPQFQQPQWQPPMWQPPQWGWGQQYQQPVPLPEFVRPQPFFAPQPFFGSPCPGGVCPQFGPRRDLAFDLAFRSQRWR